jgi:hypothetical protein
VVKNPGPIGPCIASPNVHVPGEVFLLVASQPISCDAPLPAGFSDPGCGPSAYTWEICFPFAPAALTPSSFTFTPSSNPLSSAVSDVGGCPGTCCASEAPFPVAGSLTITAASNASVSFTLAGTTGNDGGGTVTSDGSYVAPRCP